MHGTEVRNARCGTRSAGSGTRNVLPHSPLRNTQPASPLRISVLYFCVLGGWNRRGRHFWRAMGCVTPYAGQFGLRRGTPSGKQAPRCMGVALGSSERVLAAIPERGERDG